MELPFVTGSEVTSHTEDFPVCLPTETGPEESGAGFSRTHLCHLLGFPLLSPASILPTGEPSKVNNPFSVD